MAKSTFANLVRSGWPALGAWSQIASGECVDTLAAADATGLPVVMPLFGPGPTKALQ